MLLKKFVSLIMLYSALALMLGHNFIGHHHNDFGHNEVAHHHHNETEDNCDSGDESADWTHFFSGIQHGTDGLIFLTSHSSNDNLTKRTPDFAAIQVSDFVLNQIICGVGQNAPPFISDYYNSQNFLPSGLRAPPIFIV